MPRQRKTAPITFYLVLGVANLLFFLVLEAGARFYFAAQVGPRLLLYGTPWHRSAPALPGEAAKAPGHTVQSHRNDVGNYGAYLSGQEGSYSKYFPHEEKTLRRHTGEVVPVRINTEGFRGDDFARQKRAGALRVLALGASSTFGYGNRDDETYPYVLEQALNRAGRGRFEVVNFAIPHATTDNIVSMFLAEGVRLQPDFVTLYAGINDSVIAEQPSRLLARSWWELSRRLVIVRFLDHLSNPILKPTPRLRREEYAKRRSEIFLANVNALLEECRRRNIHFIAASQQATSLVIPREELKGVTYAEELERLEARAERREGSRSIGARALGRDPPRDRDALRRAALRWKLSRIFDTERVFLIHSRLMSDLRTWAAASSVDFVDLIEVLDRDRHLLLSWVHLHPEANRMVADAFAAKILEILARGQRADLGAAERHE